MVEIYISWVKGLSQNKEVLRILRESGIISGIERVIIDEETLRIKEGSLKISLHNPGNINLANPDLNKFFKSNGENVLKAIKESDTSVVGFHCGYSAKEVYKMVSYPNIPKPNTIINDIHQLIERFSKNLTFLDSKINETPPIKYILIENMDYVREGKKVIWDIQEKDIKKKKEEIEETIFRYGINSGLLYVTDPSFIKEVLDKSKVGFLFDVAHAFISADAKRHERKPKYTIEDYFNEMIDASKGRTYQIHVNVPGGNEETGYLDYHNMFTPRERLSDYIMELTKLIVSKSPEIVVLTLEMKTDLKPIHYVRGMIRQAEYLTKRLNL